MTTVANEIDEGTALITGASSGIGAVYADRLTRRGCDAILVARNRERLGPVARWLVNQTGRKVEIDEADLALSRNLRCVERILRRDTSISLPVNNAGIGATQPLIASDV